MARKKLDLTFFMVSLNVMTWLVLRSELVRVTSSLKMDLIQSYGMRGVKPQSFGVIILILTQSLNGLAHAQSRTNKPVKGMLTGPVTIRNWSFHVEDISIKGFNSSNCSCNQRRSSWPWSCRRENYPNWWYALRENCHSVVVTGMRITSTGQFSFSFWYLSCSTRYTKSHSHVLLRIYRYHPAIDNLDADVISFEASRSNPRNLGWT